MDWRQDPRVKTLLEKSNLESLLKLCFQLAHEDDEDEIEEVEKLLYFILVRYPNEDALYEKLLENSEDDTEPFTNEQLDELCEETFNTDQYPSPSTLLALALLLTKVGVFRLACELIYGSASLMLQEFIISYDLNVQLRSENGKRRFAFDLSDNLGCMFANFVSCHNSFYANDRCADDLKNDFRVLNEFIQQINAYELTDQKKKELERRDFDGTDIYPVVDLHRDPRVQNLLKKSNLESLLKSCFQRVNEEDEVEQMEKMLRSLLGRYTRKEALYELRKNSDNDAVALMNESLDSSDNDAETLMHERLDSLFQKTLDGSENLSPSNLLTLAKLFTLIEYVTAQGLNVQVSSVKGKSKFVRALSSDIGRRFALFEMCHSSFYTNRKNAWEVNMECNEATKFISQINEWNLTDEKRKELERRTFDETYPVVNWRRDTRVKKLLMKSNLEPLLKLCFRRENVNDEIEGMEKTLKFILDSYSKKEALYKNRENDAETLMNERVDSLLKGTRKWNQSLSPSNLLTLAKLFMIIGNLRLACEMIWDSASLAVHDFSYNHDMNANVHLLSANGKKRFVFALSDKLGCMFAEFESCHSSFYLNSKEAGDVSTAFELANEFIQQIHTYELTDQEKKELKKRNFDE